METIDRKEARFIAAIRSGGRWQADVCMAPDQSMGGGGGGRQGVKMTDKSHCTDLDFCWFLFLIDQTGLCTDLCGFFVFCFCSFFLFLHLLS